MAAEMAEQPDRLAALVERWDGAVAQVRALAWPQVHGSVIVARGSADHAGAHGRYLLELLSGRAGAMPAPPASRSRTTAPARSRAPPRRRCASTSARSARCRRRRR